MYRISVNSKTMQPLLSKQIFLVLLIAVFSLSGCDDQTNSSTIRARDYQLIFWPFLAPPTWKSDDLYKGMDLSKLQDNDPQAVELLKKVQEMWSNAPVNPVLNGKKVSIKGFVVPLDGDMQHVKQFLLVPYFGACIHAPPPPSNQVIHVYNIPDELVFDHDNYYIRVSGVLEVAHSDTSLGSAGYKMRAVILKPLEDEQ
jgi:uncharacterized protein